jgi:hypothetical protein
VDLKFSHIQSRPARRRGQPGAFALFSSTFSYLSPSPFGAALSAETMVSPTNHSAALRLAKGTASAIFSCYSSRCVVGLVSDFPPLQPCALGENRSPSRQRDPAPQDGHHICLLRPYTRFPRDHSVSAQPVNPMRVSVALIGVDPYSTHISELSGSGRLPGYSALSAQRSLLPARV